MKTLLRNIFVGVCVVNGAVAFGGDDLNNDINLTEHDSEKLVVGGAQLVQNAEAAHVFDVVLNVRLGANPCLAAGTKAKVVAKHKSANGETTLEVNKASEGNQDECTEEYFPIYEEVRTQIKYQEGETLRLNTNSEELGVLTLLGEKDKTIVRNFRFSPKKAIYGRTDWQGSFVNTTALHGFNPCVADLKELRGFVFTVNAELRMVLANMNKEDIFECTEENYFPVYKTVQVLGVFKPRSFSSVVVENWQEHGNDARFAVPAVLR